MSEYADENVRSLIDGLEAKDIELSKYTSNDSTVRLTTNVAVGDVHVNLSFTVWVNDEDVWSGRPMFQAVTTYNACVKTCRKLCK